MGGIKYNIFEDPCDIVDMAFHQELLYCKKEEEKYFYKLNGCDKDEYKSLMDTCYHYFHSHITFGLILFLDKDNNLFIINNKNSVRLLTLNELKIIISKYKRVEALIEQISDEEDIKGLKYSVEGGGLRL